MALSPRLSKKEFEPYLTSNFERSISITSAFAKFGIAVSVPDGSKDTAYTTYLPIYCPWHGRHRLKNA